MGSNDSSLLALNIRAALVVLLLGAAPLVAALSSYAGSRSALLVIYLLLGVSAFVVNIMGTKDTSDFVFQLIILSVSLCLILSYVFVSVNLHGYDVFEEYFQFLRVAQTGRWSPTGSDIFSAVLSITVLPTILSMFIRIEGLKIFEVVFPMMYSIVPVILYRIYRKFLTPSYAFLGVFLFMAYPGFFGEILSVTRQEVAELVLLGLVLALVTPEIGRSVSGKVVTILLTLGLIAAHYSIAYIFLGLLLVSFVASKFSRRSALSGTSVATLLIALVLTLSWYSYTASGSGLTALVNTLTQVSGSLSTNLFSANSRPSIVNEAVTFSGQSGYLHDANRLFQYAVQIFLLLGFVALIRKHGKSTIEYKMLPLIAGAMIMLVSAVSLPFLAFSLNLSRFYHVALLFIAPCFCYGVNAVCSVGSSLISLSRTMRSKIRVSGGSMSIAAVILICYFLFASGWVWAVSMDTPTSGILDSQRMVQSHDTNLLQTYYQEFTLSTDIAAARWLHLTTPITQPLCADVDSGLHVLVAYGERPYSGEYAVGALQYACMHRSYVYLSEYNTVSGQAIAYDYQFAVVSAVNTTTLNRIYSDGASIYY